MAKTSASRKQVSRSVAWKESEFEKWFWEHPVLPSGERLLPVLKQRPLSRIVDLLLLDKLGRLVLVEVKNEKTTRLAVGQVLEYLGSYYDYELDDLSEDADQDLRSGFRNKFGKNLESLSSERHIILVAPAFDTPSAVACAYLSSVLQGVEVSMLAAQRDGDGFRLSAHKPPPIVWFRTLKEGLAVSPSGRRLFCVLEAGPRPIVWWVGRLKSGVPVAFPSDKRRSVFRTTRRAVRVSAVDGVDITEQASCWERTGEPGKRARMLGVVTTRQGQFVVVIRVAPKRAPVVRRIKKKQFDKQWLPTEQPVPAWAELLDQLNGK